MRALSVVVLVVCLVCVDLAFAGKNRDRVRDYKHKKKHHRFDEEEAKWALDRLSYKDEQVIDFGDDFRDLRDEIRDDFRDEEEDRYFEKEIEEEVRGYANEINNPCVDYECPMGMTCKTDPQWQPYCTCVEECMPEEDEEYKVCSTQNVTYISDCEFYRLKCIDPEMYEIEIDYYGECQEFPECTDEEMEEFPFRMRDWFSQVMKQLAKWPIEDGGLTESEKHLEALAERDMKPYIKPIAWKFHHLDVDPRDRYLTNRELVELRAPLQRLEHCTKPFLEECDTDSNGVISFKEWGYCLLLNDDDIKEAKEHL
ncbi:SPARC-like [Ptychodera flava]|uniref:SPARC-like n=1 Tax=Ptychodera flava TaxID=63121 RepID=UPI00396A0502